VKTYSTIILIIKWAINHLYEKIERELKRIKVIRDEGEEKG